MSKMQKVAENEKSTNLVELCGTWKGLDLKKIAAEIKEMRKET